MELSYLFAYRHYSICKNFWQYTFGNLKTISKTNYKLEHAYFFCSSYRRNSDVCSAHYIREKVVAEIVLESMQRVFWYVQSFEKDFARKQIIPDAYLISLYNSAILSISTPFLYIARRRFILHITLSLPPSANLLSEV